VKSFTQSRQTVGPFYRIVFEVEGHREDTWRIYYEPRSGLGAPAAARGPAARCGR
jgi:hypothetical protein